MEEVEEKLLTLKECYEQAECKPITLAPSFMPVHAPKDDSKNPF